MSRWTSSLRLRRDSLAVGACLVAFACPAAGWAAGGTPMPAPDDPPGAFATSSSKSSKSHEAVAAVEAREGDGADPRRARGRLVRGSGRDKATGRRQDRDGDPVTRGLAAVEPGSGDAPGRHVHDSVAHHARRAEAEREAEAGSHAEGKGEAETRRQRRMRPPRPRPRRATRFGSVFRPPSSPPATPAAPRGPRCSSRRRSCLPSPREGAPSSASRRGAPRGRHDHAPCALRGGRRDGGVRSPSRLGRGARSALGELQRRRLRRLVQVERHRLVVVQLERRHGVERLRRVDLDGGHVRRDVHVHRQLRRVVRREQRHRQEGLVAAGRDGVGVPRPGRERVVHEPGELQLHG